MAARWLSALAIGICVSAFAGPADAQQVLANVKQKGFVQCGTNPALPGFAQPDAQGNWNGFNVLYCRALAAAIFGDGTKARFTPLSPKDRFTAVQSGEVDVLIANATVTASRDTALGLSFPAVNFYDGQGFMVRKKLGVSSAKELSGVSVCVTQGTTTELNLADYFRSQGMKYEVVGFAATDESYKAYDSGRCDVYTTDMSGLYAQRLRAADPDEHVILPEIISKEPLAAAVRKGDTQWADVVKWVHMALIDAEELGITKANADEMLKSSNPEIRRMLGVEGSYGEGMGLPKDWAYRIVKAVGNYAEVYDVTVGEASPLKIKRGPNALWSKGGLQYGLPVR